jgi:hypothetical protein
VNVGSFDQYILFLNDRFYSNEHISMHSNQYWSSENPGVLHEAPLHDSKVGFWCRISATGRIIGPIFSLYSVE